MIRLLRSDLGRARVLLGVVIVAAGLLTAELVREAVAVHRLTRGVGDTWFHAADGRRWFRLDAERHDVPIAAIAPNLQRAFVAIEDRRFFRHPGVDPIAIARATYRNARAPGTVEGASTITQQLARTLYLSPRKNLLRELKEAIITWQLERTLSKSRILEIYLNVAEWGNGLYGVEAAAQTYFHVPAREVTPDQAVALASILPSPRRWSPSSERAFMARRRTQLIERMQEAGYWTVAGSSLPWTSSGTVVMPELPIFDPDALQGESHPTPRPR